MRTRYLLVALVGVALLLFWMRPRAPAVEALGDDSGFSSVALSIEPAAPRAGEPARLLLAINDAAGRPLELLPHHARRLHVLLVGEDLDTLGHIHPEDFPALQATKVSALRFTFPAGGRYLLGADAMSAQEKLSRQFHIRVDGEGAGRGSRPDRALRQCVNGVPMSGPDRHVDAIRLSAQTADCDAAYAVKLLLPDRPLKAGEGSRFGFEVALAGRPVTDLAPYLDAAIHLAIVPEDLSGLLHEHGLAGPLPGATSDRAEGMPAMAMSDDNTGHSMSQMPVEPAAATSAPMPAWDAAPIDHAMHRMPATMNHHAPPPAAFGPHLHTEAIVFPAAGRYRMFAQFAHAGQLVVTGFWLDVEEGFADETARIFTLEVGPGGLSPARIQVSEGDPVVLRLASDRAADLHLHGYALERRLRPGAVTEMRFTARHSGRFAFELHEPGASEGRDVGALEVYPR